MFVVLRPRATFRWLHNPFNHRISHRHNHKAQIMQTSICPFFAGNSSVPRLNSPTTMPCVISLKGQLSLYPDKSAYDLRRALFGQITQCNPPFVPQWLGFHHAGAPHPQIIHLNVANNNIPFGGHHLLLTNRAFAPVSFYSPFAFFLPV